MYLHWKSSISTHKMSWHSCDGYYLSIWWQLGWTSPKSSSHSEILEPLNHPTNAFVTKMADHPKYWENHIQPVMFQTLGCLWRRHIGSWRERKSVVGSAVHYFSKVSITSEIRLFTMVFLVLFHLVPQSRTATPIPPIFAYSYAMIRREDERENGVICSNASHNQNSTPQDCKNKILFFKKHPRSLISVM